jgi:hypothetical protein
MAALAEHRLASTRSVPARQQPPEGCSLMIEVIARPMSPDLERAVPPVLAVAVLLQVEQLEK